jgi:hypothetical protein
MTLIKALPLGGILTFIVSEAIWAGKSSGGYLNIAAYPISGHFLHWSWPLFLVATGVIWGILLLMR